MVNEGREMTNREYREMFEVTGRTALRDLDSLVATGFVRQTGERRGARYSAI